VYSAAVKLQNRYRLCSTVSRGARRLHIPSTRTEDTINNVFTTIAAGTYTEPALPILPESPAPEKLVKLKRALLKAGAAA
jgi:hypothetical protein